MRANNHNGANKAIIFQLNTIEEFLFEKMEPAGKCKLYLVEQSGNKHVIIDNFSYIAGGREVEKFITKL